MRILTGCQEPKKKYAVVLRMEISGQYETGGRSNDHFSLDESFEIQAGDFLELMKIMAEVKGLADKLREERQP